MDDTRKDSLIEYPSQFPIKVMGAQVEGFVEAIAMVALQFDPGFDPATVERRRVLALETTAIEELRSVCEDVW